MRQYSAVVVRVIDSCASCVINEAATTEEVDCSTSPPIHYHTQPILVFPKVIIGAELFQQKNCLRQNIHLARSISKNMLALQLEMGCWFCTSNWTSRQN